MTPSRAFRPLFAASLTVLALLFAAPGCSPAPTNVEVPGEVTLDGQPLESGQITLIPLEFGSAASGDIAQGKFVLKSFGAVGGKCRVEIRASRKTGKKIPSAASPTGEAEETVSIIPEKYNLQSELFVTMPQPHLKFELSSK